MPKRIAPLDVAILLRHVDCGAITGHDGEGQWTVYRGLTTTVVTDDIAPLESDGLVERGDWQGGDIFPRRPYRLTTAGRIELNRYIDRLCLGAVA
jgi:hypothetical protein